MSNSDQRIAGIAPMEIFPGVLPVRGADGSYRRDAAEAGDVLKFRNGLHALRSSAANVGAVRLHVLCSGFERSSSTEINTNGASQLQKVDEDFARFRSVVAHHLAERRQQI